MSTRVKRRNVLSVLAVTTRGVVSRAHMLETGLPRWASHLMVGGIADKDSSLLLTLIKPGGATRGCPVNFQNGMLSEGLVEAASERSAARDGSSTLLYLDR